MSCFLARARARAPQVGYRSARAPALTRLTSFFDGAREHSACRRATTRLARIAGATWNGCERARALCEAAEVECASRTRAAPIHTGAPAIECRLRPETRSSDRLISAMGATEAARHLSVARATRGGYRSGASRLRRRATSGGERRAAGYQRSPLASACR